MNILTVQISVFGHFAIFFPSLQVWQAIGISKGKQRNYEK